MTMGNVSSRLWGRNRLFSSLIRQDLWDLNGLASDPIHSKSLLELVDGYLDRGGEIVKRGGKTQKSASTVSGATAITALGHSEALAKMIAVSSGGIAWGSAVSHAWTQMPARLDSTGATAYALPTGVPVVVTTETEMVTSGSTVPPLRYGGSIRASAYRTGTISTTSGSRVVTGSGTSWLANATVGDYLYINDSGSGLNQATYPITRVVSDTSLEVDRALDATVSAKGYSINAAGKVSAPLNIFHDTQTGSCYWPSSLGPIVYHKGRLFVAGTYEPDGTSSKFWGSRVRWSNLAADPATGKFVGMDNWNTDAYWDVSPGVGGQWITGLASIGGSLVIVKTTGTFVLRGDVLSDGPDASTISVVSPTIGSQSVNGVRATQLGVAIAARDGLYIFDGTSLSSLTEGWVGQEWRSNAMGSSSCVVSSLTDRIVVQDTNATYVYHIRTKAWAKQNCPLYSNIVPVTLNGALDSEVGIIRTGTGVGAEHDWYTDYSQTNKNDPVGTGPRLQVTFPPVEFSQHGRPHTVFVRCYGPVDAASDAPTLTASVIGGDKGTTTGAATAETASFTLAANTNDDEHRLPLPGADPVRSARVRLVQTNAASDLRIYGAGLSYAPVGRDNV